MAINALTYNSMDLVSTGSASLGAGLDLTSVQTLQAGMSQALSQFGTAPSFGVGVSQTQTVGAISSPQTLGAIGGVQGGAALFAAGAPYGPQPAGMVGASQQAGSSHTHHHHHKHSSGRDASAKNQSGGQSSDSGRGTGGRTSFGATSILRAAAMSGGFKGM